MKINACYMTKTRLMGALTGYIDYQFDGSRIVEFYHIEIEEYGIDRFEQLIDAGDYAVNKLRNEMFGRMGGDIVNLTTDQFLQLIEYGASINRQGRGLVKARRYSKWLPQSVVVDLPVYRQALTKVIEKVESSQAFAHYFLMRYFAQDDIYKYMTKSKLAPCSDYYTLLLNELTGYGDAYDFSAVLLGSGYATAKGSLKLTDRAIASLDNLTINAISDIEAAVLLRQSEHVNTYQIADENIESHLLRAEPSLATTLYPNGQLYVKYCSDDRHLYRSLYRLNGDVEVYIFVTATQLVLTSHSGRQMGTWQEWLAARFGNALQTQQSYYFKTSLLYDFMNSNYATLEDFLRDHGEMYDSI